MYKQTIQPLGSRVRLHAIAVTVALISLFTQRGFSLNPAKDLRQYVLRTWTSEQGLPQNSIRPILQTRDGFLWIGTRGGLARFDGANFVLFRANPSDSIPNDSITGLAEDRDGSLWIASAGGLTRYRDGHFHNFNSRDGLAEISIWRIAADPAGGVWAVTRHGELFHFDGTTMRRYSSPLAPGPEEVNALLADGHGTLWIATFHGLFSFDPVRGFNRYTRRDGLAGDRVFALSLDRHGELWSAGDGGLTCYRDGRFVATPVPGLATATLLAFDVNVNDDAIWTGSTGQGLFRLTSKSVQRMRVTEGLTSDELWLLYFSRDGSLWLGAANGLNQLSDGAVTSYGIGEGSLKSTLGMQSSQDPSGELWFGLDDFMVHERAGKLISMAPDAPVPARDSPKEKSLQTTSHKSSAIAIWIHSNYRGSRGLALTNSHGNNVLSDGTQEHPLPPIHWGSVGTVLLDHNGMFWTAGSQIGVLAYPAHGPPESFTTKNGLDDNNVSALAEDVAGDIWVGTLSGLNRIHHGIVRHIVSCADVTSVIPSRDGGVWASSESGLIYVPPALTPVRIFTRQDNLPTSVIEGVAEDTQGYLWLGTQQGIVRVNKADLFAHSGSAQSAAVTFGIGDGFRNTQLRRNAVFSSRDGDIWFITLEELAMIDPRGFQIGPLAPVVIDRVDVDGQKPSFTPVPSLTIPAGRHRLIIRYTLPEFRIPGRIKFRYRLEGWDKNWIEAGTARAANYTGIPPGRYTFRVENSDGYEKWSPVEATLPIDVTPYFYQTIWFLSLVAVLIFICIWTLHKMRIAQVSAGINVRMQERLQERTRIARELHDTLLQGVLGISMEMYATSQQTYTEASISPMLGQASQRLREIAEQSRKAVENLRSAAIVPDPLESMLAVALRDMSLPGDIKVQISSVGTRLNLRPLVQSEIEHIAREAISNAVRHSGATTIRLDIMYQPAHFFLSVSDDGCGINQAAQNLGRHGHWGIVGMRERAESIGGRLRILPHVPHGTVVELYLRAAVAYTQQSRSSSSSIWRWRLRR
jgi:ligand-binding sensor domain-containing protein/signal transduction histidine kinase